MTATLNKITVVVGLVISVLYLPIHQATTSDTEVSANSEISSDQVSAIPSNRIYVQVAGAVDEPGLYEMNSGDRVNDLLNIASAQDYNESCINLAQIIVDEQNLYVPAADEECEVDPAVDDFGQVNVNTASLADLETIPGIGEAKANAIIEYRSTNGTFENLEELENVEGISESLLTSISEYIKLS